MNSEISSSSPFINYFSKIESMQENELNHELHTKSGFEQIIKGLTIQPEYMRTHKELALRVIKCLNAEDLKSLMIGNFLSTAVKVGIFHGGLATKVATTFPGIISNLAINATMAYEGLNKDYIEVFENSIKTRNSALCLALLEQKFPTTEIFLVKALQYGLEDVALKLLELGTSAYGRDLDQNTPLVIACANGQSKVALKLLELAKHEDTEVEKALVHACASNMSDVALKLLDLEFNYSKPLANKDYTPLMHAVMNGMKEVVNTLIKKKAPLNYTNTKGNTAFNLACIYGEDEIALALLRKGSRTQKIDDNGNNILMLACKNGMALTAFFLFQTRTTEQLLQTNEKQQTALSLAFKSDLGDLVLAIKKRLEIARMPFFSPPQSNNPLLSLFIYRNLTKINHPIFNQFPEIKKFANDIDAGANYSDFKEQLFEKISGLKAANEHTPLEIAYYLKMPEIATRCLKKWPQEEIEKNLELIKKIPNGQDWIYDHVFSLTSSHFKEGSSLAETLPERLSVLNLSRLHEQIMLTTPSLKDSNPDKIKRSIDEMLDKIKNQTRIQGLENKSKEEVTIFYEIFTTYLLQVIDAYKIGQDEKSIDKKEQQVTYENKLSIIENFADMQKFCSPRWMREIKQLYQFRPDQAPGERITLKDRLLENLRQKRIGIITTDLIKIRDNMHNPHEANFLLDLLNTPLGLHLEKIDDPFTEVYADIHNPTSAKKKFFSHYKPSTLIKDLTNQLIAEQKKTKSDNDPYSLPPTDVYEWLRERVATKWKEHEYAEIPNKVGQMKKEKKTDHEIQTYLTSYGIDWNLDYLNDNSLSWEDIQTKIQNKIKTIETIEIKKLNQTLNTLNKISEKTQALNAATNKPINMLIAYAKKHDIDIPENIKSNQNDLLSHLNQHLKDELSDFLERYEIPSEDILNDSKLFLKAKEQIETKIKQRLTVKKSLEDALKLDKLPSQIPLILLNEKIVINKQQPLEDCLSQTALKNAQIHQFFKTEIYDEDGFFKPNAAIHLLNSTECFNS